MKAGRQERDTYMREMGRSPVSSSYRHRRLRGLSPSRFFNTARLEMEERRQALESEWESAVYTHLRMITPIHLLDQKEVESAPIRRHSFPARGRGQRLPLRKNIPEVFRPFPRYQIGDLPCHFRLRPKQVLLIKRLHSPEVTRFAAQVCNFLTEERGVTVISEPGQAEEIALQNAHNVSTWRSGVPARLLFPHIDFVIALGGDGTLLWVSHLFPNAVPPILGVSMGSLGYLAQFTPDDVFSAIDSTLTESFQVQLRCRLRVTITNEKGFKVRELAAMNDCVIDRGGNSQLATLDVYCDGVYFTTVSADGLIVATPTGSTAYSMSAGGSMVHPKVPCMLFTPICPHSLSFRPVILPDSITLEIHNPSTSRGAAWLSVDGQNRTEIRRSMSVCITMSAFPIPMILSPDRKGDPWLDSLKKTLNWNLRVQQAAHSSPMSFYRPLVSPHQETPQLQTLPSSERDEALYRVQRPSTSSFTEDLLHPAVTSTRAESRLSVVERNRMEEKSTEAESMKKKSMCVDDDNESPRIVQTRGVAKTLTPWLTIRRSSSFQSEESRKDRSLPRLRRTASDVQNTALLSPLHGEGGLCPLTKGLNEPYISAFFLPHAELHPRVALGGSTLCGNGKSPKSFLRKVDLTDFPTPTSCLEDENVGQ